MAASPWPRVLRALAAAVATAGVTGGEVCLDGSCRITPGPAGSTGGWMMIQLQQRGGVARQAAALSEQAELEAEADVGAGTARGDCSACANCVASPTNANNQAVTDAQCAPCALDGHPWWPCTVVGLCQCAAATTSSSPSTAAPTTPRPTPAPTTTTKAPTPAPTTTPSTTTPPTTTTTLAPTTTTPKATAPATTAAATTTPAPATAAPSTTTTPATTASSTPAATTAAPSTTTPKATPNPTPAPGCAACGACVAVPGNSQAATDAQCSPCANGQQSWWPCNVQGLCQCSSSPSPSPTPAPTPTTAATSTTKAVTVAPTTSPAPTPTPSPSPTPTPTSDVCTQKGPECTFPAGAGISTWFTQDLFNAMFPNICSSACTGCGLLTYNCLIKATLLYPKFANSGVLEDDKRELAAWLGEMSQETTGGGCGQSIQNADGTCSCGPMWCDSAPQGGCAAWGLCFVAEAGGTYCSPNPFYPCSPGREYKGRGPLQISWNYNYGQFSESFCGKNQTLLDNPDWVGTNPTLAWASAIWFWFTGGACLTQVGEVCKPGCHDVFLGRKTMCTSDVQAGRRYGLGWVTNIVNGGLECGGAGNGKCDYRVNSRVRFYKHFCDILGVNPLAAGWTEEANLYCATQKNYATVAATVC